MKNLTFILFAICFDIFSEVALAQNVSIPNLKIEMVLSKKEFKTFEEAQKNATDEITDGDPLWLYIKSNKPFKEITDVVRVAQSDGSVLKYHSLMLRLGPNSDWAPYNENCKLCFGSGKECAFLDRVPAEKLESTELVLNLTTYTTKGSSKVMLATVGAGMPGNWDNQVRLYIKDTQVASARLNCKVEDGIAKYKKMWEVYKNQMSKGDEDSNELPKAGNYADKALQNQVMQFVKREGITPSKVFFTQNNWTEVEVSPIEKHRYLTAVITYQKSGKCYYGVVQVMQDYSFALTKYSKSNFTLQDKDLPIHCK
ncbi:MAG: hypothetical protein SNJ55_06705 [Chloroherpetonaceae bacterium]